MLNNKGNSLAEFAVTLAIMATLTVTAMPKFSAVGENAKAKQTKANMQKILKSAEWWYHHQVEVTGMGTFPGQVRRTDNIGVLEDYNSNRRIEIEDIVDSEFVSVWEDTIFLHLFDNDTISSPYQDGDYQYAILGGSGTGDAIVSPIFAIVDKENVEDFYLYFKP